MITVTVRVFISYLDLNDYQNPIKTYFDDRNTFYIVPSLSKEIRMYLRLIDANLDDDYMGVKSSNTKQFFDIERTTKDLQILTLNLVTT